MAFDVVLEAGCGYAIESIDTGYESSADLFILKLTLHSSGDDQDYPIVLFGEYLAPSHEISELDKLSEAASLSHMDRSDSDVFEGLSRSEHGVADQGNAKVVELESHMSGFVDDEESLGDEGCIYAHSLAKSQEAITKEASKLQIYQWLIYFPNLIFSTLIGIDESQCSGVSESDYAENNREMGVQPAVTNFAYTNSEYADNGIQKTITDDEVLGKGEPVRSGDRIATWYSLKLMDGTICINATASNGPPVRFIFLISIIN